MKGVRNLLIGVLIGSVMGWAAGYLRLPFVDNVHSFWIGVASCIAFLLLIIALLFIGKNKEALSGLFSKKQVTGPQTYSGKWPTLAMLFAISAIVGGAVYFLTINRHHEQQKSQTQKLNQHIRAQSILIDSLQAKDRTALMSNVLDKLDDELKENAEGVLSDGAISRVIALSSYLKPYLLKDSVSEHTLSPERGQLLLALCAMKIDSVSFAKIKLGATFARADLEDANLNKADLSNIDLREANMRNAQLQRANMRDSDLRSTILWGADARKATLIGANMRRTDFRWAILNGADLSNGVLEGAVANNAQFMKAVLRDNSFRFADFSGAMLNEANLENSILFGAIFTKTNFTKSNLSKTLLRGSKLHQAILTGAKLGHAEVGAGWLEALGEHQIIGAEEITQNFEEWKDTLDRNKIRLRHIK